MSRLLPLILLCVASTALAQKPPRLDSKDLKQRIIWGSEATSPDGFALAFGGVDQDNLVDGNPHTRVKREGKWVDISSELKGVASPNVVRALRQLENEARRRVLAGEPSVAKEKFELARQAVENRISELEAKLPSSDATSKAKIRKAANLLVAAHNSLREIESRPVVQAIGLLRHAKESTEKAEELLSSEPSPRALSPLVYEPHTKLFFVFGGDHLDYLTNDLWSFDPVKLVWQRYEPEMIAPAPRANHKLEVLEGGKLRVTGGYTYTSSTDYTGGQYREVDAPAWIFDLTTDTWSGEGKPFLPNGRTYRTGRFDPDYYLAGEVQPNEKLNNLPDNKWVAMDPPHKPALNRDWGTAVFAPKEDFILRWSGGHSAHGGTDVIQYSPKTNRWILFDSVEFPLGQLYTNTEYPNGVSFNGRPWITGHTYQDYGCDPEHGMWFTGQDTYAFHYDPALGQWDTTKTKPVKKPAAMSYGSCFYTLTLTNTRDGLVCWTQSGALFAMTDRERGDWTELKLTGDKLLGSVVDNSTIVYDSKRNRLVTFRKGYGDNNRYDGKAQTVDLASKEVRTLTPENAAAAATVPYLCQIRYDEANDLLLCGCTLPPAGDDKLRRTPAYDPEKNQWLSLAITGDDPSGKQGRNVSLGLMYDAGRKLFWAVDTNSQVYALRLNRQTADERPLAASN
jgi:hypothetical protein